MGQQPEEFIEEEWKYLKESIIAATEDCLPIKTSKKQREKSR